jgi:cytoskeletal protein RodZ
MLDTSTPCRLQEWEDEPEAEPEAEPASSMMKLAKKGSCKLSMGSVGLYPIAIVTVRLWMTGIWRWVFNVPERLPYGL